MMALDRPLRRKSPMKLERRLEVSPIEQAGQIVVRAQVLELFVGAGDLPQLGELAPSGPTRGGSTPPARCTRS